MFAALCIKEARHKQNLFFENEVFMVAKALGVSELFTNGVIYQCKKAIRKKEEGMAKYLKGPEFYHNHTTRKISPEKFCAVKNCHIYNERIENAESMSQAFGSSPIWDFQTCYKACIFRKYDE